MSIKKGMKITIHKWFDTVTPESASDGEYESCGNEMQLHKFTADEFDDAVAEFVKYYKDNHWDTRDLPTVGVILYASSPVTDYHTGSEDYERLLIDVKVRKPSEIGPRDKVLVDRLNAAIATAIKST